MITLSDYLMGRDVTHKDELTPDIVANATELLVRINGLLSDLNVHNVKVSSGWRPPSLNATVKNAAKGSAHMTGKACDLTGLEVAKAVLLKPEILHQYQLWLEDPSATTSSNGGWTHLDMNTRSNRPLRIFKP